jgi:RNA polymerase sigma factor (sigma-70 family)
MRKSLTSVLRHLRRVVVRHGEGGLSDAQLLERFAKERDEAAFEVLVWRHGPMVMAVGRRVLHNLHDAEDVLQATFLALVRQAGSIRRRGAVGAWLHQVAYRVALRAKERKREPSVEPNSIEDMPAPQYPADDPWRDALPVLDAELQLLPEKYRIPLVLSYLEGLTNREVAEQMGCPLGTVFTRLARGRELLRLRLPQRGVALSAGLFTAAVAPIAPAATLPVGLVKATVQAAGAFATSHGAAAGVLSPNVVALTEGVLKMMWLSRLKLVSALVLLAVAGSGAGLLALRGTAQEREDATIRADDADKPTEAARRPIKELLRYGGKNFDDWRTVLATDLKPEVRAEAIKALSAFGANGYAREAAVAIVEAMSGYDSNAGDAEDWKVMEAARQGLRKIGEDAVPVLVEELKKGQRNGRAFALSAMPHFGVKAKAAIPAVIEALSDPDASIRRGALGALRQIDREGTSVPALAEVVTDDDESVRFWVIDLLARFEAKAKVAMPKLVVAAVKDDNANNRQRALAALRAIKPEPKTIVPTLREALRDKNRNPRVEAIHFVNDLGPKAKETVMDLVAALKHSEDDGERALIVSTLGNMGPAAKAAVPALTEALNTIPGGSGSAMGSNVLKALHEINK